ncbi:hypothetical protein SODALDRAFT_78016 [Sodiomyces alkalinus F11]|uniref:Uncharacterized protein n=1 Tax=Sodiomyces alkalinus (strain CBS 110278 / VKM F-3762 / F11) TaxID=1314773 RepID=A0A3N2PKV2_SODAK|nr:hypothetical protein SODALDRAFT_78016 [Sodiomyces alkalinus F11]ROT35129.1 hypothetical protein SODALDRAFT_78016 [Sodiomyces alkalinus F11]
MLAHPNLDPIDMSPCYALPSELSRRDLENDMCGDEGRNSRIKSYLIRPLKQGQKSSAAHTRRHTAYVARWPKATDISPNTDLHPRPKREQTWTLVCTTAENLLNRGVPTRMKGAHRALGTSLRNQKPHANSHVRLSDPEAGDRQLILPDSEVGHASADRNISTGGPKPRRSHLSPTGAARHRPRPHFLIA